MERLALPLASGSRSSSTSGSCRSTAARRCSGTTSPTLIRDEDALKRSEQRLTLAADGSTDGWWEWDLRTAPVLLLEPLAGAGGADRQQAAPGGPTTGLSRVHRADASSLQVGARGVPVRARRRTCRTSTGSATRTARYRWFHCRGAAARGPDDRADAHRRLADGPRRWQRERRANEGNRLPRPADRTREPSRCSSRVSGAAWRSRSAIPPDDRFAVLYLDLDRFKVVNDSLGHLVGDELLTAVSRRLESCLRPDDVLARLGGDEFAILLHGIPDEPQANAVAFRIQNALSAPFSIGGREVFTSASIGIAFGRTQYDNPDEIMRDADIAMYHAKARGKARHELFDADMHARVRDRLGLENDLRHAVSANDFEVHYQPIVLLDSGMCVGLESLIRWTRNGEPVSPATFIPLAEELGLIEPLGTWVLQQACHQFAEWRRQHPGARSTTSPSTSRAGSSRSRTSSTSSNPRSTTPSSSPATCGSRSPRPPSWTARTRRRRCSASCATSA